MANVETYSPPSPTLSDWSRLVIVCQPGHHGLVSVVCGDRFCGAAEGLLSEDRETSGQFGGQDAGGQPLSWLGSGQFLALAGARLL